jgi:hypothetical protein
MRVAVACGVLAVVCAGVSLEEAPARGVIAEETRSLESLTTCTETQETVRVPPPGINTIDVIAVGGRGADGGGPQVGGSPARVAAAIPVTGNTIYASVGCAASGTQGGYGGGGDGKGTSPSASGGGGGASDLRTIPAGSPGSLESRFLVAAGGGGAGNGTATATPPPLFVGGFGSSAADEFPTGNNGGGDTTNGVDTRGKGGSDASTSAGGAGGAGGTGSGVATGQAGGTGALGVGGDGGSGVAGPAAPTRTGNGGGGGGGLYGGGGGGGGSANTSATGLGAAGGGGGAGSSLVPVGGTLSMPSSSTAVSRILISYSYPDTQIDKRPDAVVRTTRKRATVKFAFSSPTGATQFECSVDAGAYAPCASPFSKRFAKGDHTFDVRAINAKQNRDISPPETVAFRVKRVRR